MTAANSAGESPMTVETEIAEFFSQVGHRENFHGVAVDLVDESRARSRTGP